MQNSETILPVIVITGFLGSGKTSVLNRLLADGIQTAVVINEFGSCPIDQDLLKQQAFEMTVLSGGCLCCQVKGALTPTLKNLRMAWEQASEKPFWRLLIETSGIASPEPILDCLLRDRWLAKRYRLEQIITTLAAPAAAIQLQQFAEARRQLIWADQLLITQSDLSTPVQRDALYQQLTELAPATPRQEVDGRQADWSVIGLAPPRLRALVNAVAQAEHQFHSISLYLESTPDWSVLQPLLQQWLTDFPALLRIKGVIYPVDSAEALVVQASAGRLQPPVVLLPEAVSDRRSRLVLIMAADRSALVARLQYQLQAYLPSNGIR